MSLYTLFRDDGARSKGGYAYPEMDYIRRVYAIMLKDVKGYYNKNPKNVESKNLLANILIHIPIRLDYNDHQFLGYVEDMMDHVARPKGLTNASNKGVVHKGLTLGPLASEVLISSYEDVDVRNLKQNWRLMKPLRYLYHTRTDLNLPIMNNTTPGKAYGVTVLNIPMMALQYRYWLKDQAERGIEQKETVNRFIGAYVLPGALESYTDIAMFNRLSRMSNKIGTANYPLQHPFYLTDMTEKVGRVIKSVLGRNLSAKDILDLAHDTPMIFSGNLQEVMRLPREPVTRQNEWALALARLPYIKYLVQEIKRNSIGDQAYLNQVKITLLEAKWANLGASISDNEMRALFNAQLEQVLEMVS